MQTSRSDCEEAVLPSMTSIQSSRSAPNDPSSGFMKTVLISIDLSSDATFKWRTLIGLDLADIFRWEHQTKSNARRE
jgi:hypothetical protein